MLQTEKLLSNAEEFKLTKEQAEFIIKNFWLSFREYASHTEDCRLGLSLPYISFPVHENYVHYHLNKLETIVAKTPKGEQGRLKKINILKNVIKNLDDKKRN